MCVFLLRCVFQPVNVVAGGLAHLRPVFWDQICSVSVVLTPAALQREQPGPNPVPCSVLTHGDRVQGHLWLCVCVCAPTVSLCVCVSEWSMLFLNEKLSDELQRHCLSEFMWRNFKKFRSPHKGRLSLSLFPAQ